MATIQFEDGTKVDVQGNPTPADVEFIHSQVMASKQLTQSPTLQGKLVQGDTGVLSGIGARTSQEQVGGIQKVKSSLEKGGQNILAGGQQGGLKGLATSALGVGQAAFGTISGLAKSIFAPATAVTTPIVDKVIKPEIGLIKKVSPTVSNVSKLYDIVAPKIQEIATKHPESSELANDILNTVLLAVGGGTAEAPIKQSLTKTSVKDALVNTGKDIVETSTNIGNKITDTFTPIPQNNLQKINELISPKPTIGQAKLAETQGRLYKGQEPTLFKGETPSKIATSDQQFQAVQTIDRLIPNAANMDEPTLYEALNSKIGEVARNLKPEMERVKIQPKTVENITSSWEKVKKQQLENPYSPSNVNIEKLQADFEKRLQSSKSDNMNDLWETRKAYDDSVPSTVKNATSLSSDSLQAQKEIWLQNREILNKAINDISIGLGYTSEQAFKDMSNMYTSKTGILSKASVSKKLLPSKLEQFGGTTKGKLLKGAVGGTLLYEGAKKAGLPLP